MACSARGAGQEIRVISTTGNLSVVATRSVEAGQITSGRKGGERPFHSALSLSRDIPSTESPHPRRFRHCTGDSRCIYSGSQLQCHLAGHAPPRHSVSTSKPSATAPVFQRGTPSYIRPTSKTIFSTKRSQVYSLPDQSEKKMMYEINQNAMFPLSDARLYASARKFQRIKRSPQTRKIPPSK